MICTSIVSNILGKHEIESVVQGGAYCALTVVVIDRDRAESLEKSQVIVNARRKVTPNSRFKLIAIVNARSAIPQRKIRKWHLTHEAGELRQQTFSVTRRYRPVPLGSMQKALSMKWHIGDFGNSEPPLIFFNGLGNIRRMFMEHDSHKIYTLR